MMTVGRPETISCERCNTSVVVKAKGPVPAFCADCRRKRSRNGHSRPAVVACERCGREVNVQARGPLPRFCRDGCKEPTTPAVVAASPGAALATDAVPQRPGDRPTRTQPARAAARPGPTLTVDPPPPTTPAFASATVTRIDVVHPATVVGRADIGRRLRVRRLKQAAAIAAWLMVIVIIVLILFVGSRPAAPDFDSYGRLIA